MKLVFLPVIENANTEMLAEAAVYIVGVYVAVNDCEIQKVLSQ